MTLQEYLSKPTETLQGKVLNVVLFYFIHLAYFMLICSVLANLTDGFITVPAVGLSDYKYSSWEIFRSLIAAPLWEEAAFRWAPLVAAKRLSTQLKTDLVIPVIIFSTVIFALGHSNPLLINLLWQGAGGLCMAILFIKNGYSYTSSVAFHFLWNFTAMFLLK